METFMVILMGLIGVLMGWLADWAADVLPRFSSSHLTAVQSGEVSVPNRQYTIGAALLSALSLAYLWLQLGPSWKLLFCAGVYVFFLLIALIDLKYRLVLNIVTYPAIVIALLTQWLLLQGNIGSVLVGGGFAFSIFFLASRFGDLGGGDIKLATLIGVAFGFPQMLWALLVGGGLGAVVAIVLLLRQRHTGIPYAPFLCLGAMAALFYNPFLVMR